jgi:excisionase family DNA binding protein
MIEVKPEQQEKLLTCREVAHHLHVTEITVRYWIEGGALEAIALPHANDRRSYRIKQSTLDTILAEKEEK